eukprot:COSAG02_NODE_1208_length_13883_cov_54.757998_4_plen_45_part_00
MVLAEALVQLSVDTAAMPCETLMSACSVQPPKLDSLVSQGLEVS